MDLIDKYLTEVERLTVYARLEPTKDPLQKNFPELKSKKDVVIYKDKDAKEFKARLKWDMSGKPRKNSKKIMLNGYKWNLVWLKEK